MVDHVRGVIAKAKKGDKFGAYTLDFADDFEARGNAPEIPGESPENSLPMRSSSVPVAPASDSPQRSHFPGVVLGASALRCLEARRLRCLRRALERRT